MILAGFSPVVNEPRFFSTVSGYYPACRFRTTATPVRTLERAWRLGKEAGLRFVYVGNVPGTAYAGHRLGNTYCPDCETPLIVRWGLGLGGNYLAQGRCPGCGRAVPGVWG